MQIRIGLENGSEGRSIAWALDHPGCFAYGKDGAEALLNTPRAVLNYASWINLHSPENWLSGLADFDIRLEETFEDYTVNERYDLDPAGTLVQSFFHNDWKPLSLLEVNRAAEIISWAHKDLLELAGTLAEDVLDAVHPGERWTMRGILAHVATAKWWLLDRLGLARVARADLPKEVSERLALTQEILLDTLPGLAGLEQVVGKNGELWSPRKVVRRALWHERDHYFHILNLSMKPVNPDSNES